jgi:tetratricopeptide (TPR) repeat protein
VQLEDALDRLERIHGKGSLKTLPALVEYADANAEIYEPQDQIRIYKRALKIADDAFGDDSPQYADLLFRMGRNVYEQSRSHLGEKYVDKACDLFTQHYGAQDRRVGMCRVTLGQTKMSDGYFAQALPEFEAALGAFGGDTDIDRSYRVKARSLIVNALEEIGKSDEATAHLLHIGREVALTPGIETAPVYQPAPEYTDAIITKRLRGYVVVELDVDEEGFVHNAVVVESGPHQNDKEPRPQPEYRPLEDPALESVAHYRFAPRFENGEPVASTGIRTTVRF